MGRAIHLGSRCERIPQGGIGQAALKHIGRAMGGGRLYRNCSGGNWFAMRRERECDVASSPFIGAVELQRSHTWCLAAQPGPYASLGSLRNSEIFRSPGGNH